MASAFCSLCPTPTSLFSSHALIPTLQWRSSSSSRSPPLHISRVLSVETVPLSPSFTWNDVFENSRKEYVPQNSSDLTGFLEKVDRCNRGLEKLGEFIPFVIEEQIVGYIHKGFTKYLRDFNDIFTFSQYGGHVTLNMMLDKPEERTRAVAHVIKILGNKGIIPGIRNELYPVKPSFNAPAFFSIERAAAPYFGLKGYAIHVNGYVERDGQKFLWIGKRSLAKSTYPGKLDHLVAGGLPHGISVCENLVKECEEEAGISKVLADRAIAVGVVSYMDIDRYCFTRDVLFCYDLELPQDFVPTNQDGEVDSFRLIPVAQVANVVRKTSFFKDSCSLVIIDFLFRHGLIRPESPGYLDLYRRLRNGDCS
ncbi:Nudix hydrolase 24 [Arabidopsis thaliana]|uniref:Nudix hydrolase 24, chloroplastic n=3 Tax=Arabidopsis TaxID=3701 RepID=NUD24_ARATH|nr:nudix hydrolase homolog 24 [Arabidopsis thaliana]P0C026.1 RecName: Full=Nudix hydrolase 24, chloroplastic; Short=AtNUDT24; Flags: Precursor [Arabidopsis thaliana]AED92711.1 nudix hydrolase homolog 24 [Arabidopsis thaliana]KAG7602823.1 NUDIX hydrolase domain [Arabidopsis thaliana x Arabidopsis arenosa]KAG7609770.1 NUDIX hydrolase domain [Arabidopsis suecica]|eukprot:NP_197448.2 nudix hydrolase homolog 24 [Arabidopsis thaliana]